MIPVTKLQCQIGRPKPAPLPPRIKASYPKAMTIAVGFLCSDGIVMGADTQLTAGGSHKGYACKLLSHGSVAWSAMTTYAGYPDLFDAFNGRFRDEMEAAEAKWTITASLVRDLVTTILQAFAPTDSDNTNLLCGISFADGTQSLLKTRGTLVSEAKDWANVGVADSSLIRYLLPLLAKDGVRSTQQAALIGAYLIRTAKAYIDGCGGETDIWILRPKGTIEKHSGETPSVEQHEGMTEHFLSQAIARLLAPDIDALTFEDSIASMCMRLRSDHTELIRFFRPSKRPNPR